MSKVYVLSGKNPKQTVLKILELSKPRINKKVLIKPNLTMPCSANSGIITSPKIIEGIVEYLKSINIKKIAIGDGAGGVKDMSNIFAVSGYKKLAEKLDTKLLDLNKDKEVELKIKKGYILDRIKIAKSLVDYYVINVPKMKTHRIATVTLAIKNMVGGILPYNEKKIMHEKFEEIYRYKKGKTFSEKEAKEAYVDFYKRLSDFYSVYQPNLNIIDGIIGKDGDGLTHGKNIRMNCVLLSNDAVAIDYVGTYVMGFEPRRLGYFKYLKNKIHNLREIDIIGDNINKLRKKFQVIPLTEMAI